MISQASLTLRVVFALLLGALLCQALELEPIRPQSPYSTGPGRLAKRDFSVFDLKSREIFLWGAQDGEDALLGNFTVEMPDDQEGILSMEKFDGLLTSIECNEQGLVLKFEDDSSFAYAQRVWDWVNGADNHTFLMVTGKGDCGDDSPRAPYLVSSIAYNEEGNIARLSATTGPWKDFAHTYELHVGRVPMSSDLGLKRRDYTKDVSMNLASDFRTKIKMGTDSAWGELTCNPCDLAGRMKFEFVIKTRLKIPVGFRLRMAPEGVKARAKIGFGIGAAFDSKKTIVEKKSIYKIPLAGVSIPGGILTLGPVLDIQGGVEVTGFELGAKFSAGATATLPDTAVLQADLLSPQNNEFSSWVPTITAEEPSVEVKGSAIIALFIDPALQLEAEALGQGFETGIDLKMPVIEGKMEAVVSTGGGACAEGDDYEFAIKLARYIGYEIEFVAGKIGEEDFKRTIGTDSYEIGRPFCIWKGNDPAFDKPGLPAPSKSGSLPAPSKTSSLPVPSESANANKCSVNGAPGTCISNAACSAKGQGYKTTPGYCPNDPDEILCCTGPEKAGPPSGPSSARQCQLSPSGTKGECLPKDVCGSKKYKSTPGFCPNDPPDVQYPNYTEYLARSPAAGVSAPSSAQLKLHMTQQQEARIAGSG
ncbi:MAG: hypothetical protein Q9217_005382 [Psora testacea]